MSQGITAKKSQIEISQAADLNHMTSALLMCTASKINAATKTKRNGIKHIEQDGCRGGVSLLNRGVHTDVASRCRCQANRKGGERHQE